MVTIFTAVIKSKLAPQWLSKLLISCGLTLLIGGTLILLLTFWPIVQAELNYLENTTIPVKVFKKSPSKVIEPVNREFALIVPKLNINSPVVASVNPYDSNSYQWALTKGVAHALGTALPGEKGNTFIFAHSAANFYEASHINAQFYLINKLENQDQIDIYYQDQKYSYLVSEKAFVSPQTTSYLNGTDWQGLTLMTCWPPGTTWQRLIVRAKPV